GVATQVFLPEVMAVAYRSPAGQPIPPPVQAPGGGWLHADLGSPGDRESFETVLGTLPTDADAAKVAAAAQEWRLAVCEYRPWHREARRPPIVVGAVRAVEARAAATSRTRPLEGVEVCDLTAMWAGPLATWLLAGLGATVHKVEPDARLDGFRATRGGGIHPYGRLREPGRDSAMWNALNRGKNRVALDLRVAADREEFARLARRCAVVVDSFSPRVMANFGFSPLPAGPVGVSMPAFPPGPHRDWVAYGSGVHAALGLGERDDGTYSPPLVSYPDPITGLTATLAILAAIVVRDLGKQVEQVEVSLAAATQPLLGPGSGRLRPAGRSPGPDLLASGSFENRRVAGLDLPHPLSPFLDDSDVPVDSGRG
ncbi:MAG: CoA transferase, partial [Acidimicrobiales bacterium]|nr:CoA transferase [Acidimicrobiales bacterium]